MRRENKNKQKNPPNQGGTEKGTQLSSMKEGDGGTELLPCSGFAGGRTYR